MKEKLIIRNFGPIKNVELELGRFNVLIGENATGKSVVAKVLAVCRYFSYFVYDPSISSVSDDPFARGLNAWGLNEYVRDNSSVEYECEHYSFIALAKETIQEAYDPEHGVVDNYTLLIFTIERKDKSKEFRNLIAELNKIAPNSDDIIARLTWRIPTSFFQNDVSSVLDNPFYMPTERGLQSIFSLGKSSIQNISDSLFNQFAKLDQIARVFKNETAIEPLNIIYKNENGRGYVKKDTDGKFYSLFNAASGYQSTIPVVLLVKYYSELKKKPKTFIIEEPELNLFPTAQNKLILYLVDKTINYGNSLLLTTHSPYTLTSVNNLIYAYEVGQNHKEEVENVIDKKYWLNSADVRAYRLLEDGTSKNILDEEMKLIEAGEVDEISRNLNEIFEKISNVEYSTVDEN